MLLSPPGCGHPTAITRGVALYSTSGGFVPPSGAAAWWQAYTGVTNISGVSNVADQSGNGRSLVQGNPSFRPTLNAAALNGHDTITFDGISQFLANSFAQAAPLTCYMLARQLNWTDGNVLYTGASSALIAYQKTSSPAMRFYSGGGATDGEIIVATGIDINAWKVLSWVVNGASSLVRVNDGAPTTGSNGTNAITGMYLGGYISGIAFTNMEFCEGMIYGGAHNTAEQNQTIAYLMHVGGL